MSTCTSFILLNFTHLYFSVVNEKTRNVLSQMATLFRQQINDLFQKSLEDEEGKDDGGQSLTLYINVQQPDIISFAQDVDESYKLEVNEMSDGRVCKLTFISIISNAYNNLEVFESVNSITLLLL